MAARVYNSSTSLPIALIAKSLCALVILGASALSFLFFVLRPAGMQSGWVQAWIIGFSIAFVIQGILVFRFLPRNVQMHNTQMYTAQSATIGTKGGRVVSSELGIANYLTMARGALNSSCFAFAFVPADPRWNAIPFVLYLGNIVFDFVDGYVARRTGRTSAMGESLEHEFDSIGVIAASAVAWSWGSLPLVYLLAAPARTMYLCAEYLRRVSGGTIHPLTYTISSRVIAGLYMGFLCAALMPGFPSTLLRIGGPLFLVPLVGGFVRDWLVATGTLTDEARLFRVAHAIVSRIGLGWLPVLLRAVAFGFLMALAVTVGADTVALSFVLAAGAVAFLIGFAVRAMGLFQLAVVALIVYPVSGELFVTTGAFLVSVALLVLGPGYAGLASPEETPFKRRVG